MMTQLAYGLPVIAGLDHQHVILITGAGQDVRLIDPIAPARTRKMSWADFRARWDGRLWVYDWPR
jgi:hypothetical protein